MNTSIHLASVTVRNFRFLLAVELTGSSGGLHALQSIKNLRKCEWKLVDIYCSF